MTGHPCDFAHAIGYAAPVAKPATAQTGSADAELLRLGEELERLWSTETDLSLHSRRNPSDAADDAIDAAVNGTSAIVDKIAAMRATTFPGLIVKVRAYGWCRSDGLATAEELFGRAVTTDMRIMVGVMDDLRLIKVPTP